MYEIARIMYEIGMHTKNSYNGCEYLFLVPNIQLSLQAEIRRNNTIKNNV